MNIIIDPEITRLYGYPLSSQLNAQTGFEGSALITIDEDEPGFICTKLMPEWKEDWDEFFDRIAALNGGLCDNDIITTRKHLANWCKKHPEALVGHWNRHGRRTDYGLRLDTENHIYVIRLFGVTNGNHGEIRSYKRTWLERHMSNAEAGIRFITSGYNELFIARDGDLIAISSPSGLDTSYRLVRYIDPYHMETFSKESSRVYHICEYAELRERNRATVEIASKEAHM